jgi:hypothetical protein
MDFVEVEVTSLFRVFDGFFLADEAGVTLQAAEGKIGYVGIITCGLSLDSQHLRVVKHNPVGR